MLKRFEGVPEMDMCCNEAHGEYAKGWSYTTTGGVCVLYATVASRPAASNDTVSHAQTGRVQLWASWPVRCCASMPWMHVHHRERGLAPVCHG